MTDSPHPAESTGPQTNPPDAADARRTRIVLSTAFVVYVIAVAALVVTDQLGVIWKTLVVPGLAITAAVTGRFRDFVRDWAVFLGAVMLFDAGRGLVFGIITYFKLPVYMAYAIHAERAIFGEPLLTVQVQSLLTPTGQVGIIDKLLAVAYASHFLVFLFYGLVIWLTREQSFGRFKASMLFVMYGGLIGYVLVPTVPPWMAAHQYYVIDNIQELGAQLFHRTLPNLTAAFEINPIAAMPSLHCAFPTVLTLITFQYFGLWGIAMGAYACVVFLSTVHLGHHYGVDVLGGIALGSVSYLSVFRGDRIARVLGALTPPNSSAEALRVRILVTALLVLLTFGSSFVSFRMTGGENPRPSEDFIARELDGKSPMAGYYRGLNAFDAGQYPRAQALLSKALFEIPSPEARQSAAGTLALAAYSNHDYHAVLGAAALLNGMPPGVALCVGESLVRTGRGQEGFRLLDAVRADNPDRPEIAQVIAGLAPFRSTN
jgi:membrane-associated phospholipid phosphatase